MKRILQHYEPGLTRIREQDPLKQGLKHCFVYNMYFTFLIREQDPLKQGLKLFFGDYETQKYYIREQDPLKQGLKLPGGSSGI